MWKQKWRIAVSMYGILSWILIGIAKVLSSNPDDFSNHGVISDHVNASVLAAIVVVLYLLLMLYWLLLGLIPYFTIMIGYGFLAYLLAIKCSKKFKGKIRLTISFFVHLIFCLIAILLISFPTYFYSVVDPDPYSDYFSSSFINSNLYSVVLSSFDPNSHLFYSIYPVVVALIAMFVVEEAFRYLEQRNSRRMIELFTWGPVLSWVILIVAILIFAFVVTLIYGT